jgi:pyruvate dehydrogenase E1 component alpha subunit
MGKNAKNAFTKEQYLYWFENMMLVRRFEEKAAQLYGQQKIKGFCHLYIGQEAITAGMMTAITKDDSVITAYRDHGHALAMGISANAVISMVDTELWEAKFRWVQALPWLNNTVEPRMYV